MKEFIDTSETLNWLDDEDGSKLDRFESQCAKDGFHQWPYEQPAPQEGYEYRFHGPLLYSKPKYSP